MLFKILHGDKSRISTDITPYHEGYCYVTHDGDFYVDMNNERVKLNAKDAETLTGLTVEEILASSQADWSIDDATNPAYVKNRTHYKTVQELVYIDENNITLKSYGSYCYTSYEIETPPSVGDEINITFNGTTYNFVIQNAGDDEWGPFASLGDKFEDIENNTLKYGFRIEWMQYGGWYISLYAKTTTINSFKMSVDHNTYVQLPEEYISYKPGRVVAGKAFIVDGEECVADDHAEIFNDYGRNVATGYYSHAEGSGTTSNGYASHTEGYYTSASGMYGSHSEGDHTISSGGASHAEGYYTSASGFISHAQGEATNAFGRASHAEGIYSFASGEASHAEGYYKSALSVKLSGAENALTYEIVGGLDASTYQNLLYQGVALYYNYPVHCTGVTITNNKITHISVDKTLSAYGGLTNSNVSVYIGSVASGNGSHAEGMATIASSEYQHTQGKFNLSDTTNKYAHIVGNGTSAVARSNAHTLDWDGTAWFAKAVKIGGANQDDAQELATQAYVDALIAALRPKHATVYLPASGWIGEASPYYQVVDINGVTEFSQVDLKPNAEQLEIFRNKDIAFVTENEDGVVTVYVLGDKPANDYTMQVAITEVTV